jgi:H/ACA ribonucleoprotein complex subunit 4
MSLRPPWEEQRKLLVKLEEETDPSLGRPPSQRSLEQHVRFGLINLDKPSGPSSHEVVAWVKRMLGLKHAGHGGTLETLKSVGAIQWSPACYL